MGGKLYSESLPTYLGSIENQALQDSLSFLKTISSFDILKWSENTIAIPLSMSVELPTLGNKDNIDIRNEEHIIIVLDLNEYPSVAPKVFTDRLDFPKDKLAHLYIAVNHRPPAFCYVRGNSDEWYANKRIEDMLTRISNWLRDAATGELTEDGQQFEPLRLEGYSGTIIYDYDLLAKVVLENKTMTTGQSWALALFERTRDNEEFGYRLTKLVNRENLIEVSNEFESEKSKSNESTDKRLYHYGYILWNNEDKLFSNYNIHLPASWEDFKVFCHFYGIDYSTFEKTIAYIDTNYFLHFPVIIAIKRPSSIIGFSSNIEFINLKFRIDTEDVKDGKIVNNFPINFQAHNQPLTLAKARDISGVMKNIERTAVFGCGALGSKIIMHFARNGQTNLTLIDPDHLSPHNLVRHILFADDEGINKALALKEKIKKMYPFENVNVLNGISFKDGLFEKPETFSTYSWCLDFTASEAFFNKITVTKSMDGVNIASGSVSDFGNLGILYKEGKNRNPRIDDLQAYLYGYCGSDKKIEDWLHREQLANIDSNLTVQVGVGCNSETTILSDEKVSSHSSYFTGVLKREMLNSEQSGRIFLNHIKDTNIFSIETSAINVNPFDIMTAENDETWSIRFKDGILKQIKLISQKSKNKETGGVFIGMANYKTKTIHVMNIIDAPPDSRGNSVCFYRGHQGLSEQIQIISNRSGGQMGYIGEWHSHPIGPNGLSDVDMASVSKFKTEFSQLVTPLPVFLTVVAPVGILPFVF